MKLVTWFKTRSNRVYLYTVGTAVGPVLVAHGVVEDSQVALWSGLLLAILGLTATVNTSQKPNGE
jgi:hypothetical protein